MDLCSHLCINCPSVILNVCNQQLSFVIIFITISRSLIQIPLILYSLHKNKKSYALISVTICSCMSIYDCFSFRHYIFSLFLLNMIISLDMMHFLRKVLNISYGIHHVGPPMDMCSWKEQRKLKKEVHCILTPNCRSW